MTEPDYDIETFKHNLQMQMQAERMKGDEHLERLKYYHAWHIESFKTTIAYAQQGIRSLIIINGGALIALTAFFSKSEGTTETRIQAMLSGVHYFTFGLAFAVAVYVFSYGSQHLFSVSKPKEAQHRLGIFFQVTAVLAAVASMIAFYLGVVQSAKNIPTLSL